MSKSQAPSTDDIHQDLRQQAREWRIERVGWVIMALLLLAALTGLLGPGPVSSTVLETPDARLRVEYERFARYQARATLRILVAPEGDARQVRLSVNTPYILAMQIERIEPVPEHVIGGTERFTYVFSRAPGTTPLSFVFHLQPDTFGAVPLSVWLDDSLMVHASQFLFP